MSAPASPVRITVSVLMASTATPVSVRPDSREPTVKSVSVSFCVVPPVKSACVLLGLELAAKSVSVSLGLGPTVKSVRVSLFSSVQDGMYALGIAHMRSTPSLRSYPNVAFETVPVFV